MSSGTSSASFQGSNSSQCVCLLEASKLNIYNATSHACAIFKYLILVLECTTELYYCSDLPAVLLDCTFVPYLWSVRCFWRLSVWTGRTTRFSQKYEKNIKWIWPWGQAAPHFKEVVQTNACAFWKPWSWIFTVLPHMFVPLQIPDFSSGMYHWTVIL